MFIICIFAVGLMVTLVHYFSSGFRNLINSILLGFVSVMIFLFLMVLIEGLWYFRGQEVTYHRVEGLDKIVKVESVPSDRFDFWGTFEKDKYELLDKTEAD